MSHQAKVVEVKAVADGMLAVRGRCCSDKSTDSVLTLHGLERAEEAIDQDVAAHLARIEKQHADRERTQAQIRRLIKK